MCDATWEPLTFVLCCAAVNRYGESNWARVVITIKHDNRESKLLKLCIVIAAIMLTASFCLGISRSIYIWIATLPSHQRGIYLRVPDLL